MTKMDEALKRIPGCESTNHAHCYGELWQCSKCRKTVCHAEGSDDDYHLCDDCWVEAHALSAIDFRNAGNTGRQVPGPTVDPPDMETLSAWMWDSVCEATDGCIVEHDGHCIHGCPSWFLELGLI